MMLSKIFKLANNGDTIVEVLLAILVVSAVLGGAYTSASKSLNGTRQAQERGEALKLAEGQAEQLKANTAAAIAYPNLFCFNTGGSLAVATSPAKAVSSQVALDSDPLNEYTNTCQSATIPYNLSVTRTGNAASGYLFTTYIRWFRAGGGGNEEVKLLYRLYP